MRIAETTIIVNDRVYSLQDIKSVSIRESRNDGFANIIMFAGLALTLVTTFIQVAERQFVLFLSILTLSGLLAAFVSVRWSQGIQTKSEEPRYDVTMQTSRFVKTVDKQLTRDQAEQLALIICNEVRRYGKGRTTSQPQSDSDYVIMIGGNIRIEAGRIISAGQEFRLNETVRVIVQGSPNELSMWLYPLLFFLIATSLVVVAVIAYVVGLLVHDQSVGGLIMGAFFVVGMIILFGGFIFLMNWAPGVWSVNLMTSDASEPVYFTESRSEADRVADLIKQQLVKT